jgi:hypothetical protein
MKDYIIEDGQRECTTHTSRKHSLISRLPPCPGAEAQEKIANSNCRVAHTDDDEQPPDQANDPVKDSPGIFLYPGKRIWLWGEAYG